MNRFFASLVALLPLFAVACAAESTAPEDVVADDAELSVSNVSKIEISLSSGFVAPSPLRSCLNRHNGHFEVDVVAKTVKGEGCAESATMSVDKKLTAAELSSILDAVKKVKTVSRPGPCMADGPGHFLTVKRGNQTISYTDPHNACFGGAKAANALDGVFAAAEKLGSLGEHALVGSLASVVAIGGETTGQVIQTEGGSFELEFAQGSPLASQFVDGQKAVVLGARVDRNGVEIPVRKFVVVTDMLVCPADGATINCMPPTQAKTCESGNRFWIQSHCGGVTYLD